MRAFPLVLAFTTLSLVLPALPASASACVSDGDAQAAQSCCYGANPTELALPNSDGTFYLDTRSGFDSGVVWLYEESNNESGLQRGGQVQHGYQQDSIQTPMLGDAHGPHGAPAPASVGGGDVGGKTVVGLPGMPTAVLYTRGTAPGVTTGPTGTDVHGGGTGMRVTAEAIALYDGCYDEPFTWSADRLLL